ncbi:MULTISPECIES: hypothetical protein [Acinetobacter]|uniref:hypothetical protein n=1 Tax=Acinetobacter TaxID=469 RepID=UPI000AB19A1F|nr:MULTISPECIES: hypothetical protein [Acinetobacter]MCL9677505.1 hypothetical protein [Acinetobacter sp. ACZLY 512]
MSVLLDYLNKVEEEVKKWPAWKHESLKNAFQIPEDKLKKKYTKRTSPLIYVK